MADVRLTATNPADSSVVPVACNEKGELKLEEIPDQSFDGNLDGDLTVSGSATFAGPANINLQPATADVNGLAVFADTASQSKACINVRNNNDLGLLLRGTDAAAANTVFSVSADGSANFAGNLFINSDSEFGHFQVTEAGGRGLVVASLYDGDDNSQLALHSDGSASFAGNKAGFTKEGYLWCTTRRGDTVMLDVTSNGLASWVPYTPPTRLTELQDRWSEKNVTRPKPEESSQDEPEIPQ